MTGLSSKDADKFYNAIFRFLGVVCYSVPLYAYSDYIQEQFALQWRAFLTSLLLQHYFEHRAFNRNEQDQEVDNPAQRICNDVNNNVAKTTAMINLIIKLLLSLVAFCGVLWSYDPKIVVFLLMYAAAGTW